MYARGQRADVGLRACMFIHVCVRVNMQEHLLMNDSCQIAACVCVCVCIRAHLMCVESAWDRFRHHHHFPNPRREGPGLRLVFCITSLSSCEIYLRLL